MTNKQEYALLIVKEFCNAFYKERNIDKSFKYLTNKVVWSGPNKMSELSNLDELKAIFSLDLSIIPSKFKIQSLVEQSFQISDNVYNIQYNYNLINNKKEINLKVDLFATVVFENNKPSIASLKFDYPITPKINSTSFSQHAKGGLLIAKHENKNYISISSVNKQFISIFNLENQQANNIINTNLFDYIHSEDLALFKHQLNNNKGINIPYNYKFRINIKNIYINVIATIVTQKEKSQIQYYSIIQPIFDNSSEYKNKEKDNSIKFSTTNNKFLYSDLGSHENYIDDIFTIKKLSDNFCSMLNYSQKEIIKYTKKNYLKLVYNEDIEYLTSVYKKLTTNMPKKYVAYRLIDKNGNVIWVKETLNCKKNKSNKYILYSLVENLEYLNKNNNELDSKTIFQSNIDSKLLIVDLVNRSFKTDIFENSQIKFVNKYVKNIPNSLIEKNLIYKDDKNSFLEFFNNMLKKQKNDWIGRFNLKNNKIGWYQVSSYTLFNNNMPIKAFCIIININNNKSLLEKFNKHQELIKIIISDYEFLGEYDSFTNKPIFMYSPKNNKDFLESTKNNNFDFLLNNVVFHEDANILLEEKNKTFHHTYNGIIPDNNEFYIRYRSLSKRFEGYQWGKIKYIYKIDKTSKHLHTILLIKKANIQK